MGSNTITVLVGRLRSNRHLIPGHDTRGDMVPSNRTAHARQFFSNDSPSDLIMSP